MMLPPSHQGQLSGNNTIKSIIKKGYRSVGIHKKRT